MIAQGFCVWLLFKDRKYWQEQYQTRDREAREIERHLSDQLLRRSGLRATTEPNAPQPAIARSPSLSAEDLAIVDDRINERVEAGIMRPSEGFMLAKQLRDGVVTTAQVDRILWQRQQKDLNGSVADIE